MGIFEDEMGMLRNSRNGVGMLDVMGYDERPRRNEYQDEPCRKESYVSPEIKQAHAIGRLESMLSNSENAVVEGFKKIEDLTRKNTSLEETAASLRRRLDEKTARLEETEKMLSEVKTKLALRAKKEKQ